jgi:hypothetical protein
MYRAVPPHANSSGKHCALVRPGNDPAVYPNLVIVALGASRGLCGTLLFSPDVRVTLTAALRPRTFLGILLAAYPYLCDGLIPSKGRAYQLRRAQSCS